jgi:hypothetical protein
METIIPLSQRRIDYLFLAFFLINIFFISYIVDIEQLTIPDTTHFTYPIWPPRAVVDIIHWYGRSFDPLLMARPIWWKFFIWLDDLVFFPFYLVATYAFWKGHNWIRLPAMLFAMTMIIDVGTIFSEELFGPFHAPNFLPVALANAAWLIIPLLLIVRMWNAEKPFTQTRTE